MNRREFVKGLGLSLAMMGVSRTSFSSAAKGPQIAITMDDFNVFDTPTLSGAARNQAILDAFRQFNKGL